eukprot:CAMPEP_0201971496 /NCGR_PEP_ID=MMETSP0904-20121228/37287_1 /ASSEMBLY_ACC=CAM_ASM_000553 /TAXON_ID=420261 /ORGANISM="Thalassiosira antarctica, Strain CCMP982" /LENGTH=33 /DNA_ID= /DNA_START= /DNA_END= /DNA_ORIENTATION=
MDPMVLPYSPSQIVRANNEQVDDDKAVEVKDGL